MARSLHLRAIDFCIGKSLKSSFLSRIVVTASPALLERLSRKKALDMFYHAAQTVPSYKEFLASHSVDLKKIKTFDDFVSKVPVISKKDYVKKAKSLSKLCVDGDITKTDIIVRSSGFSGRPCTWLKCKKEQDAAKELAAFGFNLLFGTKKHSTVLINGFALGSWVSGVDLLKLADGVIANVNPGLVVDEIIDLFLDLRKEFGQVIIAGNPVFLKSVVDEGCRRNINWPSSRINFLTGGESITEEWRDYIYKKIGARYDSQDSGVIYSCFGASDIGVTGINETFDSVFVRKQAHKNKKLRATLFGKADILPMLFQYNPLQFNILTDEKNNLIFTTCCGEAMTPLVKYDLHDIGGVISKAQLAGVLKQFNIKHKFSSFLPFVFVVGRNDGTVSFCSSLVYPENITAALFGNKTLLDSASGKFRMNLSFDKKQNEKLSIDFQLKQGVKPSEKLEKLFAQQVLNSLNEHNEDFRSDFKSLMKHRGQDEIISAHLYCFDDYPHKDGIKVRYV